MIIKPDSGEQFFNVATRAIRLAVANDCEVQFKFNDIWNYVQPDSGVGDICVIYDLRNEIRRLRLK